MRKSKLIITGTLAAMLAFGFILAGCDSDSDSDSTSSGGTVTVTETGTEKLQNDLYTAEEDTVELKADLVMDRDLIVPRQKTLVIPAGITLSVSGSAPALVAASAGRTLTVEGTLTIDGDLVGGPSDTIVVPSYGKVNGSNNKGRFVPGAVYKWPETGGTGWDKTAGGGTTAQAKEGAKDLAKNKDLANGVVILGDTTVVLKPNTPVTTTTPLEVSAGVTVEITSGSTLKTQSGLNVAADATVLVDNGGTLELDNGTTGRLDGTVTVGPGGTLRDNKQGGGGLWAPGATGSFVLSAGADAYLNKGGSDVHVIGGPNDATAAIQLKTGTITLKADGYEFDGNATIQQPIAITANEKLDLAEGAKIEVANGGTLALAAGSTGSFKGTIEVGAGGTLVEYNTDGGSLWNATDDTGGYVLKVGAKAYLGGGNATDFMIGEITADGNNTNVRLLLSGPTTTLELKRDGEVVLNGDATLKKSFPINKATINGTLTLTNSTGIKVPGAEDADTIVVGASGKIAFGGNAGNSNFYTAPGTQVGTDILGPAIYVWDSAVGTGGGWVKR